MERYTEIAKNLYIEPKNEEILVSFLQAKNDVPLSVPTSSKKERFWYW